LSESGRESVTERALGFAVILAAVGFAVTIAAAGPDVSQAIPRQPGDVRYAEVAVGFLLVGAGLAIALVGGSPAAGLLTTMVGIAWLAIVPAGSALGSDPLRGPGQAASSLLGPALLGLLGALLASDRKSHRTDWSIAVVLGLAGLVALLLFGSYDAFADPTCVSCRHTGPPLLVATIDQRRLLDGAAMALTIASAFGLLWLGTGSLRAHRPPRAGRRFAVLGALLAGVAVGGGSALESTGTALRSGLHGDRELVGAIELARTMGGGLLVVGLIWWIAEMIRVRVRMRQLAVDIATAADLGPLDVRLVDALDDQSVVVGYWLESDGSYISGGGEPLDRSMADVAQMVTIERRGMPIAAIWHRQGIDSSAVRNELTPSFLVALDNERLHATGLANLRALQTSRARLMEVQEQQRRQVERDLHDGIQQRLLAIVFSLRLARTAAERSGDDRRSRWLGRAETRSLALLEEVRQLAHGIHPAILSQAGLAPALASLAELSQIPMTVAVEPSVRLPKALETVVYQVIVDALADSVQAGAGELSIAVRLIDGVASVEIEGDGATASPRVRLADRVAAAGGSLSVEPSDRGSAQRLRVALPCA
jgi:signal transduction histidine kinase